MLDVMEMAGVEEERAGIEVEPMRRSLKVIIHKVMGRKKERVRRQL